MKKYVFFLIGLIIFSTLPFNIIAVDTIGTKPIVTLKDYNRNPVIVNVDSQVFFLDIEVKKDIKNIVSVSSLDGYIGEVSNSTIKDFPIKNVVKKLIGETKDSYVFRYEITTGFFVGDFDYIVKIGDFEYKEFAWFSSSWHRRVKCVINQNYIDNDLVNFPVLVRLPSSIGSMCDANGKSIRMVAPDNVTVYDYQIEFFSAISNSFVWVRIPRIDSAVNTIFYCYHNNSGAVDAQDIEDTWNANYMMVQHLNGANSGEIDDSTGNNNDVTGSGGTPQYQQTGKIGYGVRLLNSSSEYLRISDSASLDINNAITISGWVNINNLAATAAGYILAKFDAAANKRAYNIWYYESDDRLYGYVFESGTSAGEYSRCADAISKNVWVYVSWNVPTGNDKVAVLYLNGVDQTPYAVVTSTADAIYVSDRPLYIGCSESSGVPANFFNGTIDELRLSNIQRNASWIKAEYHSTNYTNGFLTIGTAQYPPNPPNNFLSVAYNCSQINITWTKTSDYTRVQKNSSSWHNYPTSISNGTNLYNGTGNHVEDITLNENTKYWYSAWSWNSTWRIWSLTYVFDDATTSICVIPVVNNPPNITLVSGNGTVCPCCIFWCINISDNESGGIRGINGSLVVAFYINLSGFYQNVMIFSNLSNGTHCFFLNNITGMMFDKNYSWNITVDDGSNISYVKTFTYIDVIGNCSNVGIGETMDVTIFIDMGLLFTLLLMIGWIVFTVLFFKNRYTKNSLILGFLQFCFAMPLTFIVGSLSAGFVLGYAIVFIIPILSILILAIGFFDRK